jgi:hypothetical protein
MAANNNGVSQRRNRFRRNSLGDRGISMAAPLEGAILEEFN